MDLVSHVVAGAFTGYSFGYPVTGAVFGILPDLVLGFKRRRFPTQAYNLTHSLAFCAAVGVLWWGITGSLVAFFAVLSHIVLDLPTHGRYWAPMLFYPILRKRFSFGEEWEWFSESWFIGLIVTVIWSLVCVI